MSSLSAPRWVHEALVLLGRETGPYTIDAIVAAIGQADGPEHRLDAPGMDTAAALHRQMFFDVLSDAGGLAGSVRAVDGYQHPVLGRPVDELGHPVDVVHTSMLPCQHSQQHQ